MSGVLGGLYEGLFGGEDIYGRKPIVPEFPTFEEAMRRSLEANFGNFDQSNALAKQTGEADLANMLDMIRKVVPNYDQMMKRSTGITNDMLRGKLPSDVVAEVGRNSAERSLAGGYGSSGMAKNLEARDLGLTSLDLTQKGLASAERWMSYGSTLAGQNQMSASAMFVNPAMMYESMAKTWDRDYLKEKIDAAPDPVARGRMDTAMEVVGMVLSAYSGGSGYKSTYNPNDTYNSGGGGYNGGGGGGGGGSRGWNPNESEYSSNGGGGTDLTKAVGFF